MEYEPAGFRARANAAIVDGVIITVATFPISLLLGILWAVFSGQGEEPGSLLQLVNMVITYGIVFLYWGWFYKNKGASPGKLMFKLKVVKTDTGKNLSYKDTFMREFLAKILSAVSGINGESKEAPIVMLSTKL